MIGVDVTLEEIENILTGYTWGSAYAFLINNDSETIFHPLLRPSTQVRVRNKKNIGKLKIVLFPS